MTTLHPTRPFGPRDIGAVMAINLLWGCNIIAVKMAVDATSPFAAGGMRMLLVLLICLPFLRLVPGRMAMVLGLGVLQGGAFLIFINLAMLASDNVSALAIAGQLSVPFALVLGVIFLGERIALARIAGTALAFGGIVLLLFDPGLVDETAALALMAASSLCWALGSLIQRRLTDVPVLTIFAWIGLVGAAMLFTMSAALEPGSFARLPQLPLRDLGWILFSALGSTVLGHGGITWLLQRHPISTVLPLTLAAPVVSVAAASLWFDNHLTSMMIVGGLVAMTGVAIITIRSARQADGAS